MRTARYTKVYWLLFAASFGGLAAAECPHTMPYQLLQDCITYEGAGSTFPSSDYAYMDEYLAWIKTQEMPEQVLPVTKPIMAAAPGKD